MLTMLEMAKQEILPACLKYTKIVAEGLAVKESLGIKAPNETKTVKMLTALTEELMDKITALESATNIPDVDEFEVGMYYKNTVIPVMDSLRETADTLESVVGKEYWPFPTYTDLLYSI
jgi:glutamine synthetase